MAVLGRRRILREGEMVKLTVVEGDGANAVRVPTVADLRCKKSAFATWGLEALCARYHLLLIQAELAEAAGFELCEGDPLMREIEPIEAIIFKREPRTAAEAAALIGAAADWLKLWAYPDDEFAEWLRAKQRAWAAMDWRKE